MSPEPAWRQQELMLQRVALALGPELAAQMAFVGGCTFSQGQAHLNATGDR